MKKLIYLTITCILLLSLSSPINAQVGLKKVAQSTMNFLLVGVAPRASAMGEAYCRSWNRRGKHFFQSGGHCPIHPSVRIANLQYTLDCRHQLPCR